MFFNGEKLKKSFNILIKVIQIKFFDKTIIFTSSLIIFDKFNKFAVGLDWCSISAIKTVSQSDISSCLASFTYWTLLLYLISYFSFISLMNIFLDWIFLLIKEFPAQKIKIFFELSIQLSIKFEISLNKNFFFVKI